MPTPSFSRFGDFDRQTSPWVFRADIAVSFCVRVAKFAGWRVSPFDHEATRVRLHMEVSPEDWYAWVQALIAAVESDTPTHGWPPGEPRESASGWNPVDEWPGLPDDVRAALDGLWGAYRRSGKRWASRLYRHGPLGPEFWRGHPEIRRHLQSTVLDAQAAPALHVYFVDYPFRAALAVPPHSALVASVELEQPAWIDDLKGIIEKLR